MFNPSPILVLDVYTAICVNERLTPDARHLFLACFLRICAGLSSQPIPSLPLPQEIGVKARYLGLNLLVAEKLATKVKKADGWHCELDKHHPMFRDKTPRTLENYVPETQGNTVTTAELYTTWAAAYKETFNRPCPRDPKDLTRLRLVMRKIGGKQARYVIQEFIRSQINTPHKANTLNFFYKHGKS